MSGSNPSLGELWHGQMILERHKQIAVPFTQRMEDKNTAEALVGQPYTEITPKDRDAAEVKVYGPIDLSAFFLSFPGIERRMRLPDVLTSLTCTFESGGGDTDYTDTNTNSASTPYSLGVSLRGQAQASSYCIPKLVPIMHETWSFNPPVTHCFFYLNGSMDMPTVLGILNAQGVSGVQAWPVFKPESITMTLIGTRVNATAQASFQGMVTAHSGASASQSDGVGKGVEHSPIIEIQHIPPCLHGAISISPSTATVTHTASTSISIAGGPISGGGAGSNTATAGASVSPSTISATSPAGLPASGLYLFDLEVEPSEYYGWYFAHAIIFDFAVLA